MSAPTHDFLDYEGDRDDLDSITSVLRLVFNADGSVDVTIRTSTSPGEAVANTHRLTDYDAKRLARHFTGPMGLR